MGAEPLYLGLISGAHTPLPRAADWRGGWGFRKCDTARSYLKLPAARPFCSRLCRVGAAIVTHPPAPQEHSSPVHPHRDTWGGSPSISLVPGARAACGTGLGNRNGPWMCSCLTSCFHLHPREKELNIGYPSHNGHKCNQLTTFQGVSGGRGI